jgi:hypothetical protein
MTVVWLSQLSRHRLEMQVRCGFKQIVPEAKSEE